MTAGHRAGRVSLFVPARIQNDTKSFHLKIRSVVTRFAVSAISWRFCRSKDDGLFCSQVLDPGIAQLGGFLSAAAEAKMLSDLFCRVKDFVSRG